ncbi:trehalose-phosphatase [Kocuria sp. JC486]|uniref:trehalose-phosphatase n=1 Tax=Kocuria sp. JC486 TaxID=1970736 RepID=UPI001423ACF2|nr:trehalose-phosphatase [Kocuria sp. JC486]NHU85220.1 trehalose-phosphatase [Kocuria sp. JC486]
MTEDSAAASLPAEQAVSDGPTAVPAALEAALEDAVRADRLLVALDFDGTLAPFTKDPKDSRATPRAEAALQRLAVAEHTWVGIISGRTMDFLRSTVDPQQRMLLSGSHGAEFDLTALGPDAQQVDIELSAQQLVTLELAVEATHRVIERYPGSTAELKPAGVCFHTRPMADQLLSDQALQEMLEEYTALDGLRITPGQQVMECSVLGATKGEGLNALVGAVRADLVVFAGDDVTDEDAMQELRAQDLGIKVGDKETVAAHRVSDVHALAEVLERLAELRERSHSRR